jgi:hypothetical protein
MRTVLLLISTIVLAAPAIARDTLFEIDPFPGTEIKMNEAAGFDEIKLVTGFSKGKFTGPTLRGERHWFAAKGPTNASALEIFIQYRAALAAKGFATLYACTRKGCPSGITIEGLGGWSNEPSASLARFGNGSIEDANYFAAKRVTPRGTDYVRVATRGRGVPVAIVDFISTPQ